MKLSVLIADHYEVERLGIRCIIERQREWEVCGVALTGAEAIERSAKLHADMLLLDLSLPDMDSVQAIPAILTVCPAIKIVVLATPGTGELAARALAAGAIGVAMKSDSANDLFLTLESIWMARPFLSPGAVTLLQDKLIRQGTSEAGLHDLTPRELEILKLRANGWTNKAISASLNISVKTVDAHRINFTRKLRLATFCDLIQFAVRHDLIERGHVSR